MNSKSLLIAIIIIYLIMSDDTKSTNTENFKETSVSRQCSSIYGYNHPKCQLENNSKKLEHVGYFKINTIKYPVIDFVKDDSKIRYSKSSISFLY